MGKQFELSQVKEDMVEFVSFLFQNNFRLAIGIATETDEDLICEHIACPCKVCKWKYIEIKNIKKFKFYDSKMDLFHSTLSIFKGKLKHLKPYDANYAKHKDHSFYPMMEYSPNYRLWVSSEAKGMDVWEEFDFLKKWITKNYIKQKNEKGIIYIGSHKYKEENR